MPRINALRNMIRGNPHTATLVFATVLFFLVRLFFLDQLFLLHDERDIVLSGLSIARTGADLYGNRFPVRFEHISPDNPLFAIYFSALSWLFIPRQSVFFARLPFVIVTSFLLILVYLLLRTIRIKKTPALLTALIFCFSPWIFHLTRLAMDINIAILMIISGMILYLRARRVPALFLIACSCFTYQGFRVLAIPLVFYLEYVRYRIRDKQASWKTISFVSLGFTIFLIAAIWFIDPAVTTNRFDELVFFNANQLAVQIGELRATSIAPVWVARLMHNKITVSFSYIISTFVKGIDLRYLFTEGDYSPINGNGVAGQFFMPFVVLYGMGIVWLGRKMRTSHWLVVLLIPLGMLPAVARGGSVTFSIRALLSGIGFAYIIMQGVLMFFAVKNHLPRLFWFAGICAWSTLFFISVFYFGYDYFARRPISVGELFMENERQLAAYIDSSGFSGTIYHHTARDAFFSYLLLQPSVDFSRIHTLSPGSTQFSYGTVRFQQCVGSEAFLSEGSGIISNSCLNDEEYRTFANRFSVVRAIPYQDISGKIAYFVVQ